MFISPPPVIATSAVAVSAMLAATASIGPRRPTAATTVTFSTSVRAAGAGTAAIGLTASPSVPSPKNKLKFTRFGLGWPLKGQPP